MGQARSGQQPVSAGWSGRQAGRQFNLAKAAARQHSLVVRSEKDLLQASDPAKRPLALHKVNLPDKKKQKTKEQVYAAWATHCIALQSS